MSCRTLTPDLPIELGSGLTTNRRNRVEHRPNVVQIDGLDFTLVTDIQRDHSLFSCGTYGKKGQKIGTTMSTTAKTTSVRGMPTLV
jgi:hypothetical protein